MRDATEEYERTVVQAVRLGLAARDIAARAGVSHGTVAAVARRHEQAPAAPPDEAAQRPSTEAPAGAGASAAEAR